MKFLRGSFLLQSVKAEIEQAGCRMAAIQAEPIRAEDNDRVESVLELFSIAENRYHSAPINRVELILTWMLAHAVNREIDELLDRAALKAAGVSAGIPAVPVPSIAEAMYAMAGRRFSRSGLVCQCGGHCGECNKADL